MSPGFIKGVLISGIVFGFESALLGVASLFSPSNRNKGVGSFLRGVLTITLFSVAFYLFRQGFVLDDVALMGVVLGSGVLAVAVELSLRRIRGSVPSPINQKRAKPVSKTQFLLFVTAGFAWILMTPAIVFTIVAPEVLPLYIWIILILLLAVGGFVTGLVYWNKNHAAGKPNEIS